MQSLTYLLDIVEVGVYSLIYCAVFRAVLHPERGRFGFLRIGVVEFFVVILLIGAYIALIVAAVAGVLVVGIATVLMAAIHAIWAAAIVGILGGIALIVALVYLALRFAFVAPMIVDDGQFHLGESWTLTRGHVGSLFMIGLVVFAILIAGEIVLGIVFVALGVGALAAMAGGIQNIPTLFQASPQALLARLGPLLAVAALLWVPFFGCVAAITAAPWARAYRDLKPTDVAAAFS